MKMTDYFNPVDIETITGGVNPLGKYSLQHTTYNGNISDCEKVHENPVVVLIGIPETNGKRQRKGAWSPDIIRKHFYRLASFENSLKLIDLGNLKKAKSHKGLLLALRDVVEYLHQFSVVVIALGGSQELTAGIAEAFSNEQHLWISAVDAVLDVKKEKETFSSTNFLTQLFRKLPNLFQFSLIGYQQHLTPDRLLSKTKEFGSHLRLGELRDDLEQAELLLRNSNIVTFDMGAINYHEAPGTSQKNPNGLRGEEACQLAYYAGLNPGLYVFGLFEMMATLTDDITPALAAEILWYFLKGVSLRNPVPVKTAYKVEVEGIDLPIVFRHDQALNQWWFELKSFSGETIEIACSEAEYRQAADNEIPDRWLWFIQKLDRLSK